MAITYEMKNSKNFTRHIFHKHKWRWMCIYVSHMKSPTPTMWPGVLYTLCKLLTCYWHIDPILVQICAKTQPNAISTSHDIGIYMPETNMATKLDIHAIYANYLRGIYRGCMWIYVPHMQSLASTAGPKALYTGNINEDDKMLIAWNELSNGPNQPKNLAKAENVV